LRPIATRTAAAATATEELQTTTATPATLTEELQRPEL